MKSILRLRYLIHALVTISLATGCAAGLTFTSHENLEGGFEDGVSQKSVFIDNPVTSLATGEKLTYEVSWIGIPVGQIILENHGLEEVEGEEAYHLTFLAISNEFLSNFFHIEDTVHTWISREKGYPLRFEKVIKEGHYGRHQVIDFDHEKKTATYYRKDKPDHQPKTIEMPPGAQDVFSVLYWIRRQPLGLGKRLVLDVNADKKNWLVEAEVIDKGVLETESMGKKVAYLLEPSATHEGKELEKGKMLVWISADGRHIPLAFQVKTPIFGSAYAILSEAILPPLPEDIVEAVEIDEDLFTRVYLTGGWLGGLTQVEAGK